MISIHALLAESDAFAYIPVPAGGISIHALLAESDLISDEVNANNVISIHALLAESDCLVLHPLVTRHAFLSTLSLRRATPVRLPRQRPGFYFYPRSPCGERPLRILLGLFHADFYPRSPCGERPAAQSIGRGADYFYPRSPCGERRRGRNPATALRHAFLSTLSLRRATC